jgi:hypothetical protein
MKSNFVRRVERLPKPRNAADALQPLFEATMNSIHSVQDKFGEHVQSKGQVEVTIQKSTEEKPHHIVVYDNGVGLDEKNFEAFSTTDTDNKIKKGGKGVGRLLWLACFDNIKISSDYSDSGRKFRRTFQFRLTNEDQIFDHKNIPLSQGAESSFTANFTGIKDNGYAEKFPKRTPYIFQHFLSHFLPIIVGKSCPQLKITCGPDSKTFPDDIKEYIYRRQTAEVKFGDHLLNIEMLECNKVVSSNLQGTNFIHFIAHDRTVHSQPIDGKLGLKAFGDNNVFHACVSGMFFNDHVNQERTQFTFETGILDEIVNDVCMPIIQDFLKGPLREVKQEQISALARIVENYPSVAFGSPEELSELMPAGQTDEEQLYATLSIHRHRRDRKQREKINGALEKLRNKDFSLGSFDGALSEASKAIAETEQRSLAEYVIRRRIVLRFLRELLKAVPEETTDSNYELESTLHNFICPIRIKSGRVEAATHDLWVVDERLTFANIFSSDTPFSQILAESTRKERPDVLVFDHAFGLNHGTSDPRVLIVEFKRPGRKNYPDNENPQFQIEEYIRELLGNDAVDIDGRPIRLSPNVRFHCYLVADRKGKLASWTSSWAPTADGRGRIHTLQGDYKGFIELIEWDQLINDAEERNKAFFDRMGID